MRRPGYIDTLTQEERAGCIKFGASLAFGSRGLTGASIDRFVKQAGIGDIVGGTGKTILAVALLGGIPLGVAAHIVNNKIIADTQKEKELKERLKYYRAATSSLESGLAGQL